MSTPWDIFGVIAFKYTIIIYKESRKLLIYPSVGRTYPMTNNILAWESAQVEILCFSQRLLERSEVELPNHVKHWKMAFPIL